MSLSETFTISARSIRVPSGSSWYYDVLNFGTESAVNSWTAMITEQSCKRWGTRDALAIALGPGFSGVYSLSVLGPVAPATKLPGPYRGRNCKVRFTEGPRGPFQPPSEVLENIGRFEGLSETFTISARPIRTQSASSWYYYAFYFGTESASNSVGHEYGAEF